MQVMPYINQHVVLVFQVLEYNLQVRFHPNKKEKLVSASVDGLMCIFDTKGDINDDEGMESVSCSFTSQTRAL